MRSLSTPKENLGFGTVSGLRLIPRFFFGVGSNLNPEKNIPIASGLGGGSINAATLVKGLLKVTGNDKIYDPTSGYFDKKKYRDLIKILTNLGTDIPVCFAGKHSLVTGIGDIVNPIGKLPKFWLVLINPGKSLSTETVYNNFM